jgi:hypothetical protein
MRKQKKVYVVNTNRIEWLEKKPYQELDNERFMEWAKYQGGVFTLEGFARQWNINGLVRDIGREEYKMRIL